MDAVSAVIAAEPDRRIHGAGTDEAHWLSNTPLAELPTCSLRIWARDHRRIWIIAPHPDDEILGLGSALVQLSRWGADVRIVSVTDGEASHPLSERWTADTLGAARRGELGRALAVLGVEDRVVRLGLPDGGLAASRAALQSALLERIEAGDLVLVTWRLDGHPDHEACADVASRVAEITGAALIEYPVWMWHWADADEASIPWARARRLPADPWIRGLKASALTQFVSQITPDGMTDAILPPHVLQRFERPFEIVFV